VLSEQHPSSCAVIGSPRNPLENITEWSSYFAFTSSEPERSDPLSVAAEAQPGPGTVGGDLHEEPGEDEGPFAVLTAVLR
jgi:hypothetical protein